MTVRMLRATLAVLLLVSVVQTVLPTRTAAASLPMPPRPGEPAPWIEAAYRAAQSNSAASDEERILAAIRAYFNLMAESHILGEALDLGTVIDRSSEAGESLYRYELGRLQYRLTMRKYYRIGIRDCQYDPGLTASRSPETPRGPE